MSTKRHDFVKEIEALLRMTRACRNIRLEYGYIDTKKFVELERNYNNIYYTTINKKKSFTIMKNDLGEDYSFESVGIYWDSDDKKIELPTDIVSIECDSLIAILMDVTSMVFQRV